MGLSEPKGALVSQVNPNTPAEKVGIKAGDIIIRYNGVEINRFNELPVKVSTTPPGSKVTLEVIREGKPLTFTLTLAELPENLEGEQAPSEGGEEPGEEREPGSIRVLGMTIRPLSTEERQEYKLPQGGLIVVQVEEGSPAQKAQIQPGDLLLEANRTPLRTPDDLRRVLAQAKGRGASALVLYVRRGDQNRFVGVEIQ
jgi:serine protease Do